MQIGLELSHAGRVMLWRLIDRGPVTVGRNSESDLCIPDDAVAPVQCLFERDGNALNLSNKSVDGTRVGTELVMEEIRLADGDVVRLGSVDARIRFVEAEATGDGGRTLTLVSGEPVPSGGILVTVPELFPGRAWDVSAATVTVGTDVTNDIVIDDPFVSSFHARLSLEAGRCMVRDLDSRNGVFVGDQKIREAEAPPGSQVKLGKVCLMVTRPAAGPSGLAVASTHGQTLVGGSQAMEDVRDLVRRVARSDAPVLITGETGTGKEVVAQMIASLSPRAGKSFIVLNCGSLSRNLIASELFGHEKGSFTGALARKTGAFEAAAGGTLFLDEIGELPTELQPQLLRVLENGEVRRVGSTETQRIDVRLIAATNRQLEDDVASGRFREDLFHRLHVLVVELPSLRERPGDVPALVRHFLVGFSPKGETLDIDNQAIDRLRRHGWPGNVRELRNVVQRAVLMRRGAGITADDITFTPSTLASRVQTRSAISGRTLQEIERDAIIDELRRHNGNKKEAAAALGVSRSTIHRKLNDLKIDLADILRRGHNTY